MVDDLIRNRTTADRLLNQLLETDITEDNYIDYFDAVNLIEIYEEDIHSRRLRVNLKMQDCRLQNIVEAKRELLQI